MVKIVGLKWISKLAIRSDEPKWFKYHTIWWAWAVWFAVPTKTEWSAGTKYTAQLEFRFAKAGTSTPINLNFVTEVHDIDNCANRKEEVSLWVNDYSYYQISKNSFIKNTIKDWQSIFRTDVPSWLKNYIFKIKDGKIKYGDFNVHDKNAMVKLIYEKKSKININFSVIKKYPSGKKTGTAWFDIIFWNPSDGLSWCNNIIKNTWNQTNTNQTNTNQTNANQTNANQNQNRSFTENSLIYYGWPSVINWSNWDIKKAENVFSKYKIVILWNWVENPNFEDYKNTKQIISDLKWKVKFYWYVPMIDWGNMTYKKIIQDINNWKYLWVSWIFVDEAWSDYWNKYIWLPYNIYKKYLVAINNYIKLQNMAIIYNSWIPEDVLDNLHLSSDDIVMIEDFYYGNGIKKQEYINHVTKYETELNKLSVKPKIYCVATATNNNQALVNQIKSNIYKKMETMCDYFDIQDDYGDDSNATVLTPTN